MLNKRLAAFSLATTLLACTYVNAYAEESYTLITAPAPTSFVGSFGGDSSSFVTSGENGYNFVIVDTEKWQETNQISFNDIKINGELGYISSVGESAVGNFNDDRYFILCETADDGSTIRHIMKYDASENTAALIETRNEWCSVTKDGYIISYSDTSIAENTEKTEIIITAPDGSIKTAAFEYPSADGSYGSDFTTIYDDNSEYIAVVTYSPTLNSVEYMGINYITYEPKYIGIDRQCETHIIDEFSNMFAEKTEYIAEDGYSCISFGIESSSNAILYNAITACYDFDLKLLCTDNGKIYDLNKSVEYPNEGKLVEISEIHNGKFIGGFANPKSGETVYALVDAENNKIISEFYEGMTTFDGDIFTVYSSDGTAGFIDIDGNVLATFEDAVPFVGEYSMAVNNGKAFLIDRSMKSVSDEINIDDYVYTAGKELFMCEIDGEKHFITYIRNDSAETKESIAETEDSFTETKESLVESEEVSPETKETAPTTNDNSDMITDATEETNPNTGIAGIATCTAVAVTALGAVLLHRKKK